MAPIAQRLLSRKSISEDIGIDDAHGKPGLVRNIGLPQLVSLGVGATIGTGIFFILSETVPMAGPATIVSFIIAGVVAGLTALCYAEMAGAVPVAGSSYSYAYATMGEGVAVLIGACLLLEYGVSAAAVAVGWSQYINELCSNLFGFVLPEALSYAPEEGGIINLPAVVLVLGCGLLLSRGARESTTANAIMVGIKLVVLLLFIAIGIQGWNSDHFAGFWDAGAQGILGAAGVVFFTFVGLDAVSTAGAEAKNPRRNMPLAIILSLIIVTTFYVAVAIVAIAAQPTEAFEGQEAGLAQIMTDITGSTIFSTVLSAGAVISIISVTLVVIYGQTRILYSMSNDGLIPPVFQKVNPQSNTPVINTWIVSVVVAVLAGVIPINFLAEMTSIGTLLAFLVVSIGVMILRRTHPNLPRSFKVPLYPVIPILSVLGCVVIISRLQIVTLVVCAIWIAVAFVYYAFYGFKHSKLGQLIDQGVDTTSNTVV
ncbi:cationic amino acid transport integral membrane protein RocE [Mycobacteroides abscessus subsp. abscessus]|nr:cationic amino acid transport integral membrane protein RocE [Mycobacteroides abscessus subsp. abscessus]